MQELRIKHAVCAITALSIFPAIGLADARRDTRTATELAGALASLVGTLKETRADFYEKALFKAVPDWAYKTHVAKVTESELLRLKGVAARYVAAGMVVGVVWDSVDGVTVWKENNRILARAYTARALVGGTSIAGTVLAANYLRVPALLARANLILMVATAALTVAISKLKGPEWVNWLSKQPFRVNFNKQPFMAESEMMDKLGDALAELQ